MKRHREILSPCCRGDERIEFTSLVGAGRQDLRCPACGKLRMVTLAELRRGSTRAALRLVWSDGKEMRS